MAVAIAAAADDDNNIDVIRKVVKLLLDGKSVSEIFVDGNNVGNISLERIKEIALMVQNENPMIKLGGPNVDAGRASVLNYNVPNSTSYKMINFVILHNNNLVEPHYDWFTDDLKNTGLGGKDTKEEKEGKEGKEEKEGKERKELKERKEEKEKDAHKAGQRSIRKQRCQPRTCRWRVRQQGELLVSGL